MDIDRIRELLQVVADSGVAEVEIHDEEFKLVVRKSAPNVTVQQPVPPPYPYNYAPPPPAYAAPAPMPPPAPAAAAPAAPMPAPAESAGGETVPAPIVGTFYRSPSPDQDAYVEVGDTVKKGDVLCIIEAMKLMNEIESEIAGTIREVLVENAQPVEFDQPLFIIDPA